MKRLSFLALLVVLGLTSAGAPPAAAQMSRAQLLAQGYRLPKQWGIGIVYYSQKQPYRIDSLILGVPGLDPALASNLKVDNDTDSYHMVLDYWALPFLNFEVLAGHIDGTTKVGLSKVDIGIPLDNIDVHYRGLFYGFGFTLAAGGRHTYATLTTEYTNTKLDNEGSSVSAWVVTPRVGTSVGRYSSVYVGGMYERPDEHHKGVYTVPYLGTVPYDVTLSGKYAWSYLIGASLGLTENWELNLESGFGDRDAALAYLSYRW